MTSATASPGPFDPSVRPVAGVASRVLRGVLSALPRGASLPDKEWRRRHRVLLGVLVLHAPAIAAYAFARGYSPAHSFFEGFILAGLACAGWLATRTGQRRLATGIVAFGLLTSSALLVHLSGGVIEAHFHFFVIMSALLLYEDWLLYALALGYVLLNHGLGGMLDAAGVYNHADAVAHPWLWAGIHAGFVGAAGVANVAAWRLNEDVRVEAATAYRHAREHEQLFRGAFDNAPIGIGLQDVSGGWLYINRAMPEITGYPEAQFLAMDWRTICKPEDRDAILEQRQRMLAGDCSSFRTEARWQHGSGRIVWMLLAFSLVRAAAGKPSHFIVQIADINAQKAVESRQALQLAVTSALAQATSLDEVARVLLGEISQALGWEVAGLWQPDPEDGALHCTIDWRASPRSHARFSALSRSIPLSSGVGLPGRVWEAAEPHWVRDVVADPNFPRSQAAAASGLHAACAFPISSAGEPVAVMEFFSEQVREPEPELMELMADIGGQIGQFVEGQRAADTLREREAELLQARKLEAVGRLAGGIAHDFNNLLTAIIGNGELLQRALTDGHEAAPKVPLESSEALRSEAAEIIKSAERAAALTRQLLAFSRQQPLERRVVDLNAVVADIEQLLYRVLSEDIELLSALAPAVGYTYVDPGQIEQVIVNLALNAGQAMPNGGKLALATANADFEPGDPALPGGLSSGRYVRLEVADTGTGMDTATLARAFEPFFTTKETDKGTGLGLSTVYGIVTQSGGAISVVSEPGRGTTFTIYLPRTDEPLEIPLASNGHGTAGANGSGQTRPATILLVEDTDVVRNVISQMLAAAGHTVMETSGPSEALELCERHRGPIDLVLTDIVMPRMSGHELAERIIRLHPDAKVLLMSGYSEQPAEDGDTGPLHAFLPKPFTSAQLGTKVREALARDWSADSSSVAL